MEEMESMVAMHIQVFLEVVELLVLMAQVLQVVISNG